MLCAELVERGVQVRDAVKNLSTVRDDSQVDLAVEEIGVWTDWAEVLDSHVSVSDAPFD